MLESADIHLVNAITDVGSISKASELLNMSQPTLSKRLARLESALDLSLFHRHNGGMIPSDAAKYIIEQGRGVHSTLRAMERHLSMLSNVEKGSLHIGVGPIIDQIYFPNVLLDFTEESSNIRISLKTDSGQRLLELLQHGSIDVGIGPFRKSDIPDALISYPVQSANIILVCRSGHPLLDEINGNGVVPLTSLAKYPSIGPKVPASFKALMPAAIQEYSALITCDNYMASKAVVSCSDYISGGPELLFEKELNQGSLVEIPVNLSMLWSSFCIVRPESLDIPAVKTFLDIFSRYLALD